MPSDPAPYAAAWRVYRRRRNAFLLCWLGVPLLVVAVEVGLGPIVSAPVVQELSLVLLFLWMTGCVLGGLLWSFFPCPRCGKPFHMSFLWSNALARRCLHCRLPKWAKGPGEE